MLPCKQCEYYVKKRTDPTELVPEGDCYHFCNVPPYNRDPVTGEHEYADCGCMRDWGRGGPCGVEGKLWVSKWGLEQERLIKDNKRDRTRTVKKLYLFPWRLKGQWKMPGVHKVVQEYRERYYSDAQCVISGGGMIPYWLTIEWATEQNQIIKKVKAGERLEEGDAVYINQIVD